MTIFLELYLLHYSIALCSLTSSIGTLSTYQPCGVTVMVFYGILKYKKNIMYYQNTCKNKK